SPKPFNVGGGEAIRALQNIADDSSRLRDTTSAISALKQLLVLNDEVVLEDSCWALYHLSNGKDDRIGALLDGNADVCLRLVKLLGHPCEKILIAALSTLRNITTGGTQDQIRSIATHCIVPLYELFKSGTRGEPWHLDKSRATSVYAESINICGGLEKIQQLQSHEDNNIVEKAAVLEQSYWRPLEEN
ncbi:hypothetical protein M8C21_013283, partial [Ambrosia artemisiifolia]